MLLALPPVCLPTGPLRPGDSVLYSFAGLGVLGSVHVLELAGFECGDSGLIVHPEDCWIAMKKGFDDESSLI